MVYVNQQQLDQMEYLIEQSKKGFHPLFEYRLIKEAFCNYEEIDEYEELDPYFEPNSSITENDPEFHIEQMILQPDIPAKRYYLETLPPYMLLKVVRCYFGIIENNVYETMQFWQ